MFAELFLGGFQLVFYLFFLIQSHTDDVKLLNEIVGTRDM